MNSAFPFQVTSGIAQAVAKILDAQKDRRINVEKCAEQVARHLETANDMASAADVRAASARHKEVQPAWASRVEASETVDWHQPADLAEEFVLEPVASKGLLRLADELAQVSRILACGIDAPTRILFSGPSGTGKTLATRWLGGRLGIPVAIVRLDRVVSSYLGETAARLMKTTQAVEACPSILFLDEIDGLCGRRDKDNDVAELGRVTSSLFQQVDALPARQIVVAATNFRDHVDPALVRRFPCEVVFKLPSAAAREAMLRRWWLKVGYEPDALHVAVEKTSDCSGAATRSLAMAAARAALLGGEVVRADHVARAADERS